MMNRSNKAIVAVAAAALVLSLVAIGFLVSYVRPPEPVAQQIDEQTIDQIVGQVVAEVSAEVEPLVISLASVHFGELEAMTLGAVTGSDLLAIDDIDKLTTKGITVANLLNTSVAIAGASLDVTSTLNVDGAATMGAITSDGAFTTSSTLGSAGDATFAGNVGVAIVPVADLHVFSADTTVLRVETDTSARNAILELDSDSKDSSVDFKAAGTRMWEIRNDASGGDSNHQFKISDDSLELRFAIEQSSDVKMNGNVAITGTLSAAGNITATKALTVGTFLKLSAPVAEQTITDGTEDIAPAGSYHEIGAGGSVANTMSVTGYDQGDTVRIVNVSAQTITITDTGTTMLSATFAMAQYDTLTLLFDGTNWLETGRSNN